VASHSALQEDYFYGTGSCNEFNGDSRYLVSSYLCIRFLAPVHNYRCRIPNILDFRLFQWTCLLPDTVIGYGSVSRPASKDFSCGLPGRLLRSSFESSRTERLGR